MNRTLGMITAAALVTLALQAPAQAGARPQRCDGADIMRPCLPELAGPASPRLALQSSYEAASRFIRGRLVCAINVNAALAARGIRGTGSALARSFLHWGRATWAPRAGDVAVFSRRGGGHVALVHHVEADGTVVYLNPSSRRQAWHVGPYGRRPIAFRTAS